MFDLYVFISIIQSEQCSFNLRDFIILFVYTLQRKENITYSMKGKALSDL